MYSLSQTARSQSTLDWWFCYPALDNTPIFPSAERLDQISVPQHSSPPCAPSGVTEPLPLTSPSSSAEAPSTSLKSGLLTAPIQERFLGSWRSECKREHGAEDMRVGRSVRKELGGGGQKTDKKHVPKYRAVIRKWEPPTENVTLGFKIHQEKSQPH